jgi:hypothetical protein
MSITLGPFLGLMPKVDAKLLGPQYAQVALDCDLASGAIAPARAPSPPIATLLNGTDTIYWFNPTANGGLGYWLQFPDDVDLVRGPVADDPYLRTYYTGDGAPKYTTVTLAQQGAGPYPGASRALGLPAPSAPTATGPTGSPPTGGQKVATSYVVTYVSDVGEEGPPSEPSNIVDRWDEGTVNLTGISIASGQFTIVAKRIYRIELNDVYQYVAEIPAATTTFADNFDTEFLGEPVPSSEWVAPNPNMRGLVAMRGGFMAGFWGNTVAFSERGQPHAWPIRYRLPLDFEIVAVAESAQGLMVGTKGAPYVISGTNPETMQDYKIEVIQACISKRSMVDMGEFVLYASPDGLVAAGGAEARVITRNFITPEQWMAKYNPASIHAVLWGERYLGFYSGGAFSFSPEEGFKDFTQTAQCAFLDKQTGEIYFKSGTQLRKWWGGAMVPYTYRSKTFSVPAGDPLRAAKVSASAYPVTMKIYQNGVLRKTHEVESESAFRIPDIYGRYESLYIELTGLPTITGVQMARTMTEII